MTSRIQWQSPGLFWIAMIALAIVLTAALVLYRPQVRPLSHLAEWAWLLPWVRVLALGVLAVALLRPAILSPARNDGQGIVAVLIDRSKSMNAVDTARPPEELVRTAAGLGLLSPSARPAELSELRDHVVGLARLADEFDRATAELKYARLAGRGMDAAAAHLQQATDALDSSVKAAAALTSAPLHDAIAKIGGDSASQQIAPILDQIDAMQVSADMKLYQSNPSVRDVCDNLAIRSRIELVSQSLTTESFEKIEAARPVRIFTDSAAVLLPAQFDPTMLTADEVHTDLVGQLRDLHRRLTGQHVAAVILFSDGRENNQTSPADALVDWPEVPIVAIDVGSPKPKDLSFERISIPASAAVGENVRVRATVRQAGFDARDVEVTFTAQQQRQVNAARLSGETTDVEFAFIPEHAGPCRVTFAVAPQTGEASTANNRVSRTIKVTSDRSTVAVIAGSAAADIQELLSILKDAPGVALVDGSIESGKCPLSASDLRSADVAVLSDVPLDALDEQQWNALNSAVTQRGGSIIICGGEPGILASYARRPLIASMLPWRGNAQPAWRTWPGETPGFRIAPADGTAFEAIKLSNEAELNRTRWNQMPPLTRIMSLPPPTRDVRKILSERDSGLPVVMQITNQAGRAFFVGTDELWRWNNVAGDGPQSQGRFWTEFIRMAGHPPYTLTDGELGLDADRLAVEPGESLRVRARVPATGADLRIERNGSLRQEMPIGQSEAPSGRFESVINDLDTGDYALRLIAGGRELSLPLVVAANDEDEMRDISGNQAELRRITGSRGAVLSLAELPSLPQRLAQLQTIEAHFNERRLWDSPYLFLFVVSCFGVEWAIRKHVGLT